MMNYVYRPMPLNLMTVDSTQEEEILDLRVPEKQKINAVDYSLIYPTHKASPTHNSLDNRQDSFASFNSKSSLQQNRLHSLESAVTVLSGSESPNSTVSSTDSLHCALSSRTDIKNNRPFKTLTKDPFHSIKTAVNLLHDDIDYPTFRDKMLAHTRVDYNTTNMNMRRKTVHNENNSDPVYWEKRKKNNEAAKKSRDARKAREDEVAIRCAFLEQENLKLKLKIAALQSDTTRLQSLVYRL